MARQTRTNRLRRSRRNRAASVTASLVPSKRHAPIIRVDTTDHTIATRRALAYEIINTLETIVSQLPQITPLLQKLEGGVSQAIQYLRGSDHPDAKNFLQWYDSVSDSHRDLLPLEAFTVPAGITTKRLLELVMGACFEQSAAATELLVKASHPKIVQRSIDIALDPYSDGIQDRKMLHQHMGFLPIPKTSVVNVRGNVDNLTQHDNRDQRSVSVLEISTVNTKVDRITNRFNEKLGLGDIGRYNGPTLIDEPEEPDAVESTEVAG